MAVYKYGFQKKNENVVKASARNINISPKQSIEICNYIRGRPLAQAKMLLERSSELTTAIPFKRFTNGLGHKPGISSGRYAVKASLEILKVLKSAESNAKNKGYNSEDLRVLHAATQRGPKNPHYGRKKRSVFKNVHIEIVLEEVKGLAKKNAKSDAKKTAKTVKSEVKEKKTTKSESKSKGN